MAKTALCWVHLQEAAEAWKAGRRPGRQCWIAGCSERVRARQLCRLHYVRWWRHGDPNHVARLAVAPPAEGGCKVCGRPVVALGWCQSHYVELRDTDPCQVDGCARNVMAKGWCRLHYQRVQRDGTPGPAGALPAKPKVRTVGCAHPGCDEPHRARGYCATHYKAARREGLIDPLQPQQRPTLGGRR